MNIMNHPFTKLSLYLLALIFFEFLTKAADLQYEDIIKFTWWDWLKFNLSLLAPAMLVIRSYTDSSFSRYMAEKQETKERNSNEAASNIGS